MDLVFRQMEECDVSQVNKIYNEAIKLNYATAHTEALPSEYHMQWLQQHLLEGNPILLVCNGDKVLGWNSLSFYRSGRKALAGVRETSYYIHEDYWNIGLATMLMEKIIVIARDLGVNTLVTFIMDANKTSVHLMNKFAFEKWGSLPAVLKMPGGDYDHLIFGKKI